MNAQAILRKRNLYFGIFLGILAVFITLIIVIGVTVTDLNDLTLYYLILFLGFLVVVLYFKKLLASYNNLAKIAKVIQVQAGPIPFRTNVIENPKSFYDAGYQVHSNNQDYTILYKLLVEKNIKYGKHKRLYIALLIKNKGFDFYNKNMHDDINRLENKFKRKEFPNKYMITAFKAFDTMTEEHIKAIGEVVCYSVSKQSYVQINVGLALDEKLAYFLYSDSYDPNRYYKEAVEIIKNSVK
ncbi:hypothetical protein [Acholeplasma hippikon]|uniref:DUF3137 domain-containing protein n=1 Tax=Acholeplasma hippikon TaxID=264636 RepID=A0A449BL69_9MOLU|nr:hypothetical protein [Acholeplasma hippikon]VEU83172.1 Uncharacterised protein [Acholeplasma hippikon]